MFATSSRASSSAGSIGLPVRAESRERAGGDVGQQRDEQAAQAALVLDGSDQVEGVGAVQQPARTDLTVTDRGSGDLWLLPRIEAGRDGLQ